MAMYYYASKLNDVASCSGCHRRTPPPAATPPPQPGPSARTTATGIYIGGSQSPPSGTKGGRRITMNGAATIPVPPNEIEEPQRSNAGTVSLVVSELEYRDGQLVSGTLEALVDLLRPGADRGFLFAFLLSSRLYVRPHELLAMLCKRHTAPPAGQQVPVPGTAAGEALLAEMTSLIRLLGEWTRSFPYDFRDDRVMALLRTITQRCAAEDMVTVRDEVSVLLQKLLDRLTALERYEESLVDNPPVSTLDQLSQLDILSTGLAPLALAKQLTLIELHRLSFIGPEEFVQTFIKSSSVKDGTYEPKKTKNLEAYADWFNRLSYLVATDVLKSLKTKQRARVLEHWVLCARECFNLGNFNSLMAIVGALNMAPISRLKKTWSRCGGVAQQLPPLERCMEPGGNHARYRAALAAANTSTHPAVPCFSVTCRDLHFINQAVPTRVSGNRINLDKCRALARHVSEQLSRCHVDTGISRHECTWHYLLTTPVFTQQAMELATYEREAPYDHSEKDRYKSLRQAA